MHVLIVGVAGTTGRMLAEAVLAAPGIACVTGLDPRPCLPPVEGLRFVRARVRQPEWVPLLSDVDAVMHVTGAEWPGPRRMSSDVSLFEDTRFIAEASQAAGVRRLVVVTGAAVYGWHRASLIAEDTPVRGHEASAYARVRARAADYLDLIAARGDFAGGLTRLRTAWLCGARHSALVDYARTNPIVVRGFADHTLDVIHEQDAVAAMLLALRGDLPGVYNVSADEPVTFRELAALVGQDRDPVSLRRALLRAWWRWRWRGASTPPGWVRGLYRTGQLDTRALRAAGWQPHYTAHDAVRAAIEGRGTDRELYRMPS